MHLRLTGLLLAILPTTAPAQGRAPVEPATKPPVIAPSQVTETFFGITVVDPYRGVEGLDAGILEWMRASGKHTRSILDSIPPRASYLAKLTMLTGAFGTAADVQIGGDQLFYRGRAPGRNQADLMVRAPDGSKRTLIDMTAYIAAHDGVPQAIDYYAPSRDGKRVAVGISSSGSENSAISVIDTATGKTLAGPIDRAQFGNVAWLDDSSGLFFSRRQNSNDESLKYLNSTVEFWDFRGEPEIVVGAAQKLGPNSDPTGFPGVATVPGSDQIILAVANGVQPELEMWIAPLTDAKSGTANWRKIARHEDAVTSFSADKNRVVLLTHADAPTFKVTAMTWSGTAATAKELITARADRVNESVGIARDGIYVGGREGLNARPLVVDATGRSTAVRLPYDGTMGTIITDSRRDGAVFNLDAMTRPPTTYLTKGAALVDLKLEVRPDIDYSKYSAVETFATAKDGAKVPMTILTVAGPVRARPTLLDAYGAYGISVLPAYNPRELAFVDAGGTMVECSVRGGGELGEAWRLGGKDANKPNTWRDAIACGETLVKLGYTTKAQLAITGTSAGGIMVGRAATERPDLFAAAISRVGDSNSIRSETMASGPANVPEFGTVADPQGFKNLYAMDAYQHVVDGTVYPAWMLTTGLHDPRVAPWQAAKMTARLQAAGGPAPVLLRIEEEAGHGVGTTRSARDAEDADIAAFIFWRSGVKDWQPVFSKP